MLSRVHAAAPQGKFAVQMLVRYIRVACVTNILAVPQLAHRQSEGHGIGLDHCSAMPAEVAHATSEKTSPSNPLRKGASR